MIQHICPGFHQEGLFQLVFLCILFLLLPNIALMDPLWVWAISFSEAVPSKHRALYLLMQVGLADWGGEERVKIWTSTPNIWLELFNLEKKSQLRGRYDRGLQYCSWSKENVYREICCFSYNLQLRSFQWNWTIDKGWSKGNISSSNNYIMEFTAS